MTPIYQKFLYDLGYFNIKLGLENITYLLEKLGSPHHHPRIIHIAGTSGKGSTLAALESLLLESGFTTGSTISPHLISVDERFRINGKSVSSAEVDWAFIEVCRICGIDPDNLQAGTHGEKVKPTFFEFTIAMAFFIFSKYEVDYILLETGMGGRLDATNVVPHPLACILTRMGLDHQEYLGETIEEITTEKLGILKPDAPVFVAPQEPAVLKQILETCEKKRNLCFNYPDYFRFQKNRKENQTTLFFDPVLLAEKNIDRRLLEFSMRRFGLRGDHQIENISTALATYYHIVPPQDLLLVEEIQSVLENLYWPGRLEYLKPTILIDCAHNAAKINSLYEYLKENHPNQKILFCIGWLKKKNVMLALHNDLFRAAEFIPLQMDSERGESHEIISQQLKEAGLKVHSFARPSELPEKILKGELPEHDLLVITGAMAMLGEFLEKWQILDVH